MGAEETDHDLHQRVERLEARSEEQRLDMASLIASRRIWGWIAGIAAPVVLGAVVTTLLWSVDKISASSERVGATSARIESLEKMVGSDRAAIEKLLDKLDQDIRELRRHTGLDPKPITIVTSP